MNTPDVVRTTAVSHCPLCHTTGNLLYTNQTDRLFAAPGHWHMRQCPQPTCGLVWLDPQPWPEDVHKLYTSYYTHTTTPYQLSRLGALRQLLEQNTAVYTLGYDRSQLTATGRLIGGVAAKMPLLRDFGQYRLMWLRARENGRLLDIGCGNGDFLAQMHTLGWQTVGLEPDAQAAAIASRRPGLEIHQGTAATVQFPANSFDVITLSHVIEHVPDPVHLLQTCAHWLTETGQLIVLTPNIASLGHRRFKADWRGLEIPRHLHLFTPAALHTCAVTADLSVQHLHTTARAAPMLFRASHQLQKNGRLPHGIPARPTPLARLAENLFWLRQHWGRGWHLGEEILLVARKRPLPPPPLPQEHPHAT
jgi:2-polyprenyl-3-methyl-5-hydroxy-6-metoxy-1,4-benzoquinol methylase